jgi:hypothetical protein
MGFISIIFISVNNPAFLKIYNLGRSGTGDGGGADAGGWGGVVM